MQRKNRLKFSFVLWFLVEYVIAIAQRFSIVANGREILIIFLIIFDNVESIISQ